MYYILLWIEARNGQISVFTLNTVPIVMCGVMLMDFMDKVTELAACGESDRLDEEGICSVSVR